MSDDRQCMVSEMLHSRRAFTFGSNVCADCNCPPTHRPTAYLPDPDPADGEHCRACDQAWPCDTARDQ